jgi:hypothetical protein
MAAHRVAQAATLSHGPVNIFAQQRNPEAQLELDEGKKRKK